MLYALTKTELDALRRAQVYFEFTGAEMLMAAYRTDPAVVAQILPRPLKPAPDPLAFAFVGHYPRTNFGSVYNEGALLVRAILGREEGFYCLAMPVTDDMAMVGGREYFGFPKKIAESITLERAGNRVVGSVCRRGTEILRIELEPTAPVEPADLALLGTPGVDRQGRPCRQAPSFLYKFFPSPDGKGFDYLPRLVRQVTLFAPRPGLQKGQGHVVVKSSPWDPLGDIPVRSVEACFYGLWDNSMLPGRVCGAPPNRGRPEGLGTRVLSAARGAP